MCVLFEFSVAFHFECASEKLLFALLGIVDVLVGTVAFEPFLGCGFLCHGHAEV